MKRLQLFLMTAFLLSLPNLALAAEIKANKTITIGMFLVIIGITLSVVVWAA